MKVCKLPVEGQRGINGNYSAILMHKQLFLRWTWRINRNYLVQVKNPHFDIRLRLEVIEMEWKAKKSGRGGGVERDQQYFLKLFHHGSRSRGMGRLFYLRILISWVSFLDPSLIHCLKKIFDKQNHYHIQVIPQHKVV